MCVYVYISVYARVCTFIQNNKWKRVVHTKTNTNRISQIKNKNKNHTLTIIKTKQYNYKIGKIWLCIEEAINVNIHFVSVISLFFFAFQHVTKV